MDNGSKMTAYCGLVCTECPTYTATMNDDDKARGKVAMQWSKQYNTKIEPGDINCDGCKSGNGRLFKFCNMCEVRKCGEEKKVETCAHCDDYECSKIQGLFGMEPRMKKALDRIRASLS
jgi:hypothetical protein